MGSSLADTAQEKIKRVYESLTRAERQLAGVILENYPMSGMGSITRLADKASVSTPTVARMVQKLGYSGFPDFQDALRIEVEARFSNPIAKHESWAQSAPEGHILNRFTDSVISNIRQTLANVDPKQFDDLTGMLADESQALYITGGRITHALSEYLHLHMQVIRARVRHIRSTSNAWPHDLLDIRPDDVVLIYDIRRYENSTLRLAEIAKAQGAKIALITDQWQSPISQYADVSLNCRIEAPSAWDSTVAMMLLSETLIAAVQEASWDRTKSRMSTLEDMFDQTKIFRKFV
ncbi:MurR/RpiR family transcriptional regulator [Shimia marina]|uniref:DNA-binding transcriptional repressor RpiR n=1 Tax=Shimia marina TaxID=321267 RepID=A0A0P1ERQ2_9RHOB|nr:MurR/RpiR family transcriptional regulator [Shimia marina]CUH53175.1 DNA-binding transcriptional repressor RpiR [Shimia marina]SFD83032.1 transcriptional regulator, RpiR family [Shimia marina]